MIHDLIIRESNKDAHYDIQRDMLEQKDGIFTFIIKVSGGNICDYVRMQTKRFNTINEEWDIIPRYAWKGGGGDAIWHDDLQCGHKRWSSYY